MDAPIHIYVNKKSIGKKILLYVLGFLFFIACFLIGMDYAGLFDPKVILMPVCAIVMVVLTIDQVKFYNRKMPIIILDTNGIQLFGKFFDEIGVVLWKDLDSFREIAVGRTERRMIFYSRDLEMYAYNIANERRRKKFIKASQYNGNGVLWIEMSKLGYDQGQFKQLIREYIKS